MADYQLSRRTFKGLNHAIHPHNRGVDCRLCSPYGVFKAILAEEMTIGDWWETEQTEAQITDAFGRQALVNSVRQAIQEGRNPPAHIVERFSK